jgi:hypothetical protein
MNASPVNLSYAEFLRNKSVVIVGPCASILGSQQQQFIHSHDVVVRVNHGWPVAEHMHADLGSRVDVIYHCCNGDYPIKRLFSPEFAKVDYVCYQVGWDSPELVEHCMAVGVKCLDATLIYSRLRQKIKTHPNTGAVAIYHLISLPLRSLYITGFSFFKDHYYPGYLGKGAPNTRDLPLKPHWKHDQALQLDYFRKTLPEDPRIKVDKNLESIIYSL